MLGGWLRSPTEAKCTSRAVGLMEAHSTVPMGVGIWGATRPTPLVVDVHRSAEGGPAPEKGAVGVREAQTAVRGGVAPVAAPVVVVQAGAIAGEVLREQHVGQEVPAWPKPRDANRVTVHRLVRYPADDPEHAERRRPRARAMNRQRRQHGPIVLVRGEH